MRVAVVSLALVAGCGSSPPPGSVPPPPGPSAQLVNAVVLTNGCQSMGRQSALLAESAMSSLVEGCASVPGGSMQFHATLQPGGRVEISATPGQPEVVPICILKHALVHRVPLTKPCPLDVKIEQTSVPMTAPPAPP
ncbi:MAG: hypothetical protein ABSE49_12135 [Polyangiaceae bacterium]|jgi:hypothetical protein